MTFFIVPRGPFVLAIAAIILEIETEVYHDFQEFESSETLGYGIFNVETNLDWLNVTDNSKRYPQISMFLLDTRKEGVAERFCLNHRIYLRNKQVFLVVDKDDLQMLAACFNASKPSNNDLSRFSLSVDNEFNDFQLKHIKTLQSLGIKFGLTFGNVNDIQPKLENLQGNGVGIDLIIFQPHLSRLEDYTYDFNSFVKYFNEQFSLLKKSISGYDLQIILQVAGNNAYRNLHSRFAFRWGEMTKSFAIGSEPTLCKETFVDKLDHLLCEKGKIFKNYAGQKPSYSVRAYAGWINATGQMLENVLMCKCFESVFIEVVEFREIDEEDLMRLAFAHSNLPCKVAWNVRWHTEKGIISNKNQNNSNHLILASIAEKHPGLIKEVFLIVSRVSSDNVTFDYGTSKLKPTVIKISNALRSAPLTLLEYVRAESAVYNKQEELQDYSELLSASDGASIVFAGSSFRPELLEYVAKKRTKRVILINFSIDNFRKEKFGSCLDMKKQWNVLRNWAGANSFQVVVSIPLSTVSYEGNTPWLKNIGVLGQGFEPQNATSDELQFLSNFDDICVAMPQSVPSFPVKFNATSAGVTLNLTLEKYSRLGTEDIAELLLLIHFKFNVIEIVPKHHTIQDIRDAIQHVKEFANASEFLQCRYFLNILPENLYSLNSSREFIGVHIDLCLCENDSGNLNRLRNSSASMIGVSISYENAISPDRHDLWINHTALIDYVVIHVNLAEALLTGPNSIANDSNASLNKTIRDYIKHNPQDIPPNPVFDNLRATRFNIKRWNPDAIVYMKIAWPTIQNTRSTERTQKIWEYLNDFSNIFQFPFFINEAFDSSVQRCTDRSDPQYGWWKVTSEYNIGNSENYIDKQAEFYDFDTVRPVGFRKNSTQNSTSESLPLTEIVSGASAFLLLVILVAAVLIYRLRSELQMMLTKEELREFEMGRRGSDCDDPHSNDYCSIAYNKEKYEISKAAFKLDPGSVIGSGNFGLVYKASLPKHDKPVAVKVPKICGKVELLSVFREIKLMSYVGEHENILKLVGAYTREVQKGIVYVITEYVEHGSLLEYLRKIPSTEREKEGLLLQLNQFCLDISKGMHYLSEKKVVHGDLSARNVLLDSCNVCKISDFGLSRKLYYLDIYVKQTSEPVPWKWMAVEALERSELSLKSDIWSLGVTFWEIYSFAEEPYQCVSWDLEFSKKLLNGLRLPKPEVADESIYEVILSCWKIDPDERPSTDYFIGFFQSLRSLSYTNL